jgi:colanic acid/amylovoran biosynthesis protein
MKKVTIINAYGDKNIGDATILNVAVDLIKQAYKKDFSISVLCESESSIQNSLGTEKNIKAFQLPYGYAIRSTARKLTSSKKIFRFINIFLLTTIIITINILFKTRLTNSGFYSYISAIKDADIVIGMGGGYFIAQSTKDYFGLLLTLLPVYVAKIYKKKIIFLPISFGPFSDKYQEKITYQALTNTTVIARDKITLNILKKLDQNGRIKLSYAPDLALFFNIRKNNIHSKLSSSYITLTAREWFLDQNKQQAFETALTKFIENVWSKYQLKTQFIPMAKSEIEDNDVNLADRISSKLKNKKILYIVKPNGIIHVQNILKNARIAVCTRMHSAILSATVSTPFIAIGYGHKTLGLVRNLGLTKWYVDINNVSYNNLTALFDKLMSKGHYNQFVEQLSSKQKANEIYKSQIINLIRS